MAGSDVPSPPVKDGPKIYDFSTYGAYNNKDKINGVVIRRDVPNHLKPADLNYNTPVLQTVIAIKDLKTVGDLIARVAKQTRIELYCEPNYEKKALTWTASGKIVRDRLGAASGACLLRGGNVPKSRDGFCADRRSGGGGNAPSDDSGL